MRLDPRVEVAKTGPLIVVGVVIVEVNNPPLRILLYDIFRIFRKLTYYIDMGVFRY